MLQLSFCGVEVNFVLTFEDLLKWCIFFDLILNSHKMDSLSYGLGSFYFRMFHFRTFKDSVRKLLRESVAYSLKEVKSAETETRGFTDKLFMIWLHGWASLWVLSCEPFLSCLWCKGQTFDASNHSGWVGMRCNGMKYEEIESSRRPLGNCSDDGYMYDLVFFKINPK